MIATNLSGKSFTVEDIVRLFHRRATLSLGRIYEYNVLQDGVCGGKRVVYVFHIKEKYILKEMGINGGELW